jgi:hypothetical protein
MSDYDRYNPDTYDRDAGYAFYTLGFVFFAIGIGSMNTFFFIGIAFAFLAHYSYLPVGELLNFKPADRNDSEKKTDSDTEV